MLIRIEKIEFEIYRSIVSLFTLFTVYISWSAEEKLIKLLFTLFTALNCRLIIFNKYFLKK